MAVPGEVRRAGLFRFRRVPLRKPLENILISRHTACLIIYICVGAGLCPDRVCGGSCCSSGSLSPKEATASRCCTQVMSVSRATPDVLFVERFEEPALTDLFTRWTDIKSDVTKCCSAPTCRREAPARTRSDPLDSAEES